MIEDRVAKRFLIAVKMDVPPDFQGSPKLHGIESPRGGGFSIMQTLQKDLVKEEDKEIHNKKAMIERVAMYWNGRGRTYRLTKGEKDGGDVICPKCRSHMTDKKFTRSERMYCCDDCGFMVPTGKVVKEKIIETEPEEELEVKFPIGQNSRRIYHGF